MAVTVTQVGFGQSERIWEVIATADADTTAVVPHGFADAHIRYSIVPIEQATAGLSLWAVTGVSNVAVTLTKSVAVGSGSANPQLRVFVEDCHSRHNLDG